MKKEIGLEFSRIKKNYKYEKKKYNYHKSNFKILFNYLLAKHKAAVTPMKPKNGAEVGQVS
jgi:hypothetical protein